MSRYARQIQLPDVGTAGQARLSKAKVAVIGAGGLGSPVLHYLTGAGVGQLTLYDPDHVEESNLHRQPLFKMSDLGRPKAEAAANAVKALNPKVEINAHVRRLTPANALDIVSGMDVVLDAADSFAVSFSLSDACVSSRIPLISASVLGQAGYVGGYCGSAPSLRAVFPDPPSIGATCATAGVLGPVVGVIGALQAQMALRTILSSDPSPLGRVVSIDLANLQFGGFEFLGAPEPKYACPFLSKDMLRADDLIIELRDRSEADQPITSTAKRMTMEGVSTLAPQMGRRIVLCCSSGLRAWRAASALQERGFGNLALLAAKACA